MKTEEEDKCKCVKIEGHLEVVKWLTHERIYKPSAGYLSFGDWTQDPHIWLHYVESNDGTALDDDVLMCTDPCYWDIHDVQRYFLGNEHCSELLYTYQYPNLKLSTRYGEHLWRANTAMKLPSKLYLKELNMDVGITLKKMKSQEHQMDRLIVSDQLIRLDRFDYFSRKTFMRLLLNILSFQNHLQLVSFENMRLKRLEGVRLIQELACFNSETLKYLYLWEFVLPNENPLLINYSYLTGW